MNFALVCDRGSAHQGIVPVDDRDPHAALSERECCTTALQSASEHSYLHARSKPRIAITTGNLQSSLTGTVIVRTFIDSIEALGRTPASARPKPCSGPN